MGFVPHKPEQMIMVEVSVREATLIAKLRKYPYGKFTVDKIDNYLTRVLINDSQSLIDDAEGLELAIVSSS